jgi:hypothetical protein
MDDVIQGVRFSSAEIRPEKIERRIGPINEGAEQPIYLLQNFRSAGPALPDFWGRCQNER